MATNMSKGILRVWQPRLDFVRYRKVNIQKPFPPHFTRAVVEDVCKPVFARPREKDWNTPLPEVCLGSGPYWQKTAIENPYVTLLAKELLNWLNHSKLIAFFHRNPMTSDENYEARLLLHKKLSIKMKLYGKEVVSKAVVGTKFEPVLSLYQSHTVLAFGPNADVKGLLKCVKKMPKLILLGAVVDDRLLSRAELNLVSTLGDLDTARAGLVHVLNMAGQSVVRPLTHHQQVLVRHLESHAKSTGDT